MHILIVPSWYPGHPDDIMGVFFRQQAVALYRYGHQVGVIHAQLRSLSSWKSVFSEKHGVEEELDEGVRTLRFRGMGFPPSISSANTWLWISLELKLYGRYIDRYGHPDLIHVHSMLNAGTVAQSIASRYGIPFIVTEHSTAFARGRLRPEQIRRAQSIARSAKRRLAVSEEFCSLLGSTLGAHAGSWEEMPNIVEQRFVDRPLRVRDPNRRTFVFLSVAVLTPKKGVHGLIQAFARAFADEPAVTLEIGGDGVERSRLEAQAMELGIADRVRFLGALDRDQVAETMARADAFVLASKYETFGVVVIEALALGKPVIATRCGGPESIVREQDGLLVPPDDIRALADAMKRLRAEYHRYQGADIRAACIARYSEQAVAERLTRVYGEVIRGHSRA